MKKSQKLKLLSKTELKKYQSLKLKNMELANDFLNSMIKARREIKRENFKESMINEAMEAIDYTNLEDIKKGQMVQKIWDTRENLEHFRKYNNFMVATVPTLRTRKINSRERLIWIWKEKGEIKWILASPDNIKTYTLAEKGFKRKYVETVEKNKEEFMVKLVPRPIVFMMEELAREDIEWGGAIDYELLVADPSRVILYTGDEMQINLNDLRDLEVDFHIHPSSYLHKLYTGLTYMPSSNDIGLTVRSRPSIITFLDPKSGRKKHILIVSLHKNTSSYRFDILDKKLDDVLEKWKFRKKRFRYWKEECNKLGYDFNYVDLEKEQLFLKRDVNKERYGRKQAKVPLKYQLTLMDEKKLLNKEIHKLKKQVGYLKKTRPRKGK